ncbi:MAG TPA: HAMP domain-containing sensor histidine kinase [Phycisphaerae bacterium]|jgi:signal transduction histidine kinase
MQRRSWFSISLAAKCRYLFGAAVIFIIAVAYYVPWTRVSSLANEVYSKEAQRIALAARLPMDETNWEESQKRLNDQWPEYARMAGLRGAAPRLVSINSIPRSMLREKRGFEAESIDTFERDPTRSYTYKIQDDGRTFRLAWPVRSMLPDARPAALLGIIDVTMPIDRKLQELGWWNLAAFLLSGAVAGMLAILVFYLITQKLILSPVRDLRGVAEQVAAGDLEVRSGIATGDEFEELAESFNDMLAHLKATQDELRTINRSLDVRLGELAETNVALFESNRLKSEFLANVSHELRTPLVSIIGFAELLRDAAENPSVDRRRWVRYAENILVSGRMLLDIINDLLDLAKIEAGRLELHLSEFPLRDVCESMLDFIRPLADKKNLALEVALDDDLPRLRSDSGKIKQILYNLLSNAVKFTPPGGRVGLAAGAVREAILAPADQRAPAGSDGLRVELTVWDTGPGISREDQAVIFEKFRQLDASKTREYGGTGLGLAITRELTAMLGGAVRVESELGVGSRFTVTLPLEAPQDSRRPLLALT